MIRSALRRRVYVPSTTTAKSEPQSFQYLHGLNYGHNDSVLPDQFVYATDTRQNLPGRWDTRKGCDLLSVPIGEAINVQQTSTTGANGVNFGEPARFAKKITALSTGRLTAIGCNISNPSAATGTIVYALYTDVSGAPGIELVRTTVAASSVTTGFQYVKARSITCPDIISGTVYWVVGYVQTGGTGTYRVSTTTNATTGKLSTDSGLTWNGASLDYNVKLYTATPTPTKGCIRIRRPNGISYTFLAHGTTLYSINEGTGAVTAVDTGLEANSTAVRFDYVNDVLRYVQTGVNVKPRKYDFTTASSVTAAPENASGIISHKGLEFFMSSDDTSKFYFTNFGLYDTFTSTDFFYAPSPKTGDPVVGFSKLNGSLIVHTRNNKYVLSGSENATFSLDTAVGQKGTFSQESIAYDEDFVFLASDDGIYKFNGAEEKNIAQDVLPWWDTLLTKRNTTLELYNNRLYVYYTPNGESSNTRCMVYHILYDIWESDDTRTHIGATYASADQTGYFIQASNRVGMLMLAELETNDNVMLGEPLAYEVRTKYDHFGTPAQLKRASAYRPHFDTVAGTYGITVGYALDYSTSTTSADVSLAGSGARFNSGYHFNDGVHFGATAQINPGDDAPRIGGQWRRLQLRYSHEAAREPVSFDGHVVSIETGRLT